MKWVSTRTPGNNELRTSTFEVVRVAKTPEGNRTVRVGDRINLQYRPNGEPGEFYLLIGGGDPFKALGERSYWELPEEVTKAGFNHIVRAPSPNARAQTRYAYFLKFLGFSDPLVVSEAHRELSKASYKELAPLAPQMSRAKLCQWITNPKTPADRLALYGLMLGVCGTKRDAEILRRMIIKPTENFRLGIDGVMSGYLLLAGEQGLELLDQTKLKNRQTPFSEAYHALRAIRFMFSQIPRKIEKERLLQSVRFLLERPEMADLAIADLARWKDWSVQDRLMGLYVADDYKHPWMKRAIIGYMIRSTQDVPTDKAAATPEHVLNGRAHLETLRKRDPEVVRKVEKQMNHT